MWDILPPGPAFDLELSIVMETWAWSLSFSSWWFLDAADLNWSAQPFISIFACCVDAVCTASKLSFAFAKKGFGFNWRSHLHMWTLGVLPVPVWVFSGPPVSAHKPNTCTLGWFQTLTSVSVWLVCVATCHMCVPPEYATGSCSECSIKARVVISTIGWSLHHGNGHRLKGCTAMDASSLTHRKANISKLIWMCGRWVSQSVGVCLCSEEQAVGVKTCRMPPCVTITSATRRCCKVEVDYNIDVCVVAYTHEPCTRALKYTLLLSVR